jgi:hypothetical protein
MNPTSTRALLAMLLLAAAPAFAQMYKWVDADGNVHYSDQPPPAKGVKEQRTIPKPAAATPAQGAAAAAGQNRPKTPAEQEMEFRKRRLEAAEAEAKRQKEAEESDQKRRNCEQAKARVAMLQNGGRIVKASPTGEQIYLDDADIARELVEARKIADSWCND